MRTITTASLIGHLMPSSVRTAVLSRMLLDEQDWHPRELARALGLSASAVSAELSRLEQFGLTKLRRVGNQSRYSVDKTCPVYAELRSMMLKTAGLGDVLRNALAPLSSRIKLAYVFGSLADGSQHNGSDVDLMVVGDVLPAEIVTALQRAEEMLGREINAAVYRPAEYEEKLRLGRGFIHHVHTGEKILLLGDPGEPS